MKLHITVKHGPWQDTHGDIELFNPKTATLENAVTIFIEGCRAKEAKVVIDRRHIQVQQIVHYGPEAVLLGLN